MAANCSSIPEHVSSDAGVAGIGVLLSFIATAAIALAISATLILQEMRSSAIKPSILRRKLLNAYSDQQILTGIGIQSVGLAKTSTMVPYHFFIIWMLSLLSMAVHNATLLALVHDFRRDWVLRWLRQLLMFCNLVLSCVYGIFVLRGVQTGLSDSTLPIACVWSPYVSSEATHSAAGGDIGTAYVGTIAVIAGNDVIFGLATWYLHARTQRFYRIIQLVGMVLMTASAVGATARVVIMAQAFGEPPVPMRDEGERVWSFGSLLSVGMLLLPLVSVVEILRGEIRCAPPVGDDDRLDDKSALLDDANELESRPGGNRTSFQPNPFWGSQTNLFVRK
ncbi:hypothetical protein DL766_004239 [Monosporascus sp. MC13-8B]|nr:hypothetical protein DL766_004239 [Monosporascus sp. MC13-8B]